MQNLVYDFLRTCYYQIPHLWTGIPSLNALVADHLEQQEIIRSDSKFSSYGWPRTSRLSVQELIRLSKPSQPKTCHIIASGSSALSSISKIKASDYVIGFNYAALLPLKFNLYFLESCTNKTNKRAILSSLAASLVNTSQIDLLIYKNLWLGFMDYKLVCKLYQPPYYLLNDLHLPYAALPWSSISCDFVASRLISCKIAESGYLMQTITTTFSAIVIALRLGFSKIVIHGFDFGGAHFYSTSCFHWPDIVSGEAKEILTSFNSKSLSFHTSMKFAPPLLISLQKLCNRKGVSIVSASNQSRSSVYIGAYED